MPRANEIKKGMVLNYNGKLLIVKNIDIQSPSARGAATLYKMRFSDVRTGLKVEERFKGDDIVDTVTLTRRFVDFSYVDGNEYVFMDKEDYTPYTFTKEQIEEELQFIPEGGMPDMQVLTWDGQLLALELPQTVDLEIKMCIRDRSKIMQGHWLRRRVIQSVKASGLTPDGRLPLTQTISNCPSQLRESLTKRSQSPGVTSKPEKLKSVTSPSFSVSLTLIRVRPCTTWKRLAIPSSLNSC